MGSLYLFPSDDNTPKKACSKCKRVLTADHFHRKGENGLQSQCKECKSTKKPSDVPEGYKRCSNCKGVYLATLEYFSAQKSTKSGLRSHCKVCTSASHQEYTSDPEVRERLRAYSESYQSRPEIKQHRHDYHQAYHARPDVREHRNVYKRKWRGRPEVKGRERVARKAYYSRPEIRERENARQRYHWHSRAEIRERRRAYESRPEVRARVRAYDKKRGALPERKEYRKIYYRSYYHRPESKEQFLVYSRTRRARKKAAPGTLTVQQIQQKLRFQRFRCYYCSTKFNKHKGKYVYHLDHIVPLSRPELGPRHDMSSTVLACPHCNLTKSNRLLSEWPEGGRLL